jgi:hypothetical protein
MAPHTAGLDVVQEIRRKRLEVVGGFHQPRQHGVRINLEHPRYRADTQAFSQRGHHAHEPLGRHAPAMQGRAMGFEKIASARHTGQLPPGTATGMAIRPDIAAPHPAIIVARWLGAEMVVGCHGSRAAI